MTPSAVGALRAVHDVLLTGLGLASFAAAACLLVPSLRARAESWAAAADAMAPRRALRLAWCAAAAWGGWFLALKAVQYRAFQLHIDTGILVNAAANTLRGRWLASVVDGTPNVLSVHFAFFVPLFLAPVLLLWKSALPFALLQTAALASTGPAAFLAVRRRTESAALGFLAMGLVYAHPSFHELNMATVENAVFGPPLFLWGLAAWDAGRPAWTALCWALALTTREQFPFTVAGLGVYHAWTGRASRRKVLEGLGVVLAAAAVWALEMRVVGSFKDAVNAPYWTFYARFGSSKDEVMRTVLTRPHRVLGRMFWPPSHLWPLARLGLLFGGFPFLDLGALAALVVSAVHELLKDSYHFRGQTASYTFGPLVFAMACGLRSVRLPRVWLFVPAFLAAGWGLCAANRLLHPRWGLEYMGPAEPLVARIPPDAPVWAQDYAASWLTARPLVKVFDFADLHVRWERMLFRPEFVLVDKGTLIFMPAASRARLLSFLAREGYARVASAGTLVLLSAPGASGPLDWGAVAVDQALADGYLAALLDDPALSDYPPLLRYAPGSAEQHATFAAVLTTNGRPDLAVRHLRRAVELWPEFVQARNNLGNVLAALGDLGGAERELRGALALEPGLAATRYNLGNVLLRAGKAAEAAAELESAAAERPADARVRNSLGAAYLMLKRREEARVQFEKAVELDPGLEDARVNLRAVGGGRVQGS